jgi:hypothetical protein
MTDEPSIVDKTGLAVVSRGEIIVPDTGSEAVLAAVRDGELVLEFPVEVEVRIVPACDPDQHIQDTLEQFTAAVQGLV